MFTKLLNFLEKKTQSRNTLNFCFVRFVSLTRLYKFTVWFDDKLYVFKNVLRQTQYNTVRAQKLSRYREHEISDLVLHTNFELLCEYVKKNFVDIMVPDEVLETMCPQDKYRCKKMRELYYWWNFEYSPDKSTMAEIIQKTTECIELQLTFCNGEKHDQPV